MSDTLPGCLGYFGKPLSPNNCEKCRERELCRQISERFVPKREISKFIAQLNFVISEKGRETNENFAST